MPRVARIKSSTGIYQIINRGINQQNILSCDDDYKKFLNSSPDTAERAPVKYMLTAKEISSRTATKVNR